MRVSTLTEENILDFRFILSHALRAVGGLSQILLNGPFFFRSKASLFDGYTFGQVSWLVYILPFENGYIISQKL